MSKMLSKIMIICAIIVILPLMIVGTTFAAYYSIDAVIAFDIYTNRPNHAEGAFAKVYANAEEMGKDVEIKDGHLKTVTFFADADGYDFVGWFAGDEQAYAVAHSAGTVEFVSEDETFEVKMSDYEQLLAVFEVREYSVSYSYRATPTGEIVTTLPKVGADRFTWGENLVDLEYDGYDAKFLGWREQGTSNTPVMTAKFNSKNVVLEAVWQAQEKINITYVNGTTTLKQTQVYAEQPYTILAVEDVIASEDFKDGYTYSWVDAKGNPISKVVASTDTVIYLKEEAIVYTTTLENSDLTYSGGSVATFTAKDISKLEGLFKARNFTSKYSFHTYAGISYNGTIYSSAQELANAIIADYPNGTQSTISLTILVDKAFETVSVENKVTGKTTAGAIVYKNNDFVDLDTTIAWTCPNPSGDSTQTLEQFVKLENVTLYSYDGGEPYSDPQQICAVEVELGGWTFVITNVNEDTTMTEIIARALEFVEVETSETFTFTNMTVIFETQSEPETIA